MTPGFWKQLKIALLNDSVTVLDVVKAEILRGDDELTYWISEMSELKIMDRRDQSIMLKYSEVLNYLQCSPLYNDKALRSWSDVNVADPWLIAAAAANLATLVPKYRVPDPRY